MVYESVAADNVGSDRLWGCLRVAAKNLGSTEVDVKFVRDR